MQVSRLISLVFVVASLFFRAHIGGDSVGDLKNTGNVLDIPSVGIHVVVLESQSAEALNRGAWHMPSGNPVVGGNVLVAAHRNRPGARLSETFWRLPLIKVGDSVILQWYSKPYKYSVVAVTIVQSDDTQYTGQTVDPQLTLITCISTKSGEERLIVKAKPSEY